jgi:hypothetical protein
LRLRADLVDVIHMRTHEVFTASIHMRTLTVFTLLGKRADLVDVILRENGLEEDDGHGVVDDGFAEGQHVQGVLDVERLADGLR